MYPDRELSSRRVVRVFVSSTFRDMQHERDALVKRAFPELRRRCRDRGLEFVDVDLRWGITDDQARDGQVIPICLDEIDRCRPYFVCLLGTRYGWIPEALHPSLIERWPWLSDCVGRSVTEFEILHGVLREPARAQHCWFHVLGGDHRVDDSDSVPLAALRERISAGGHALQPYRTPDELAQQVLDEVWASIDSDYPAADVPDALTREANAHTAFGFARAHVHVGRVELLHRLTEHVRGDGPPIVVLGDAGAGKSALLSQWWRLHGQGATFRSNSDTGPVTTIAHFINASGKSSDHVALMQRLIGELNKAFDIGQEMPKRREDVVQAFGDALHRAADRGRWVLLLDGVDELEDERGARELDWLPKAIPANVRLIVSSESGPSLDALKQRGWPTLVVDPLQRTERETLLKDYLGQYGKALPSTLAEEIVALPQATSPLFLRLLLEELRIYGDHDTLVGVVRSHASARSVQELYEGVLARYERDFEGARPGLVGDAFSLLAVSRTGLTETEIRELLGANGSSLPQSIWSPLYIAAEHAFVEAAGNLRFDQGHITRAVRQRYLSTPELEQAAHRRLADYFEPGVAAYDEDVEPGESFMQRGVGLMVFELSEAEGNDSNVARSIECTLWHLAAAKEWRRLYDRLANLGFVTHAYRLNSHAIDLAWAALERETPYRMVDAYARPLREPASYIGCSWMLIDLFQRHGHVREVIPLARYSADFHGQGTLQRDSEGGALGNFGSMLLEVGDVGGALEQFEKAEAVFRQRADSSAYDREGLPGVLVSKAQALGMIGDTSTALGLFEEAAQISRGLDLPESLGRALLGKAKLLDSSGVPIERTRPMFEEAGRLFRGLGRADHVASWAIMYGPILGQSDPAEALGLLQEAAGIGRDLGQHAVQARALTSQAILVAQVATGWQPAVPGVLEAGESTTQRAMLLLNEACAAAAATGKPVSFAQDLATVHDLLGQHDEAFEQLVHLERHAREIGDQELLADTLASQIGVLSNRSLPDLSPEQADADYQRGVAAAAEIRRLGRWTDRTARLHAALEANHSGRRDAIDSLLADTESKRQRAILLGRQALARFEAGELEQGIELSKEAARGLVNAADHERRQAVVGNHAEALQRLERWEEAYALREEEVEVCRSLGDPESLQMAIEGLARCAMLRAYELSDAARQGSAIGKKGLFERATSLFRRPMAADAVRAGTAVDKGSLFRIAAIWFRRAVAAHRELGNAEAVAMCFGAEALALQAGGGDLQRALGLHNEAAKVCREAGIVAGWAASLAGRAEVQDLLGEREAARQTRLELAQVQQTADGRSGITAAPTGAVQATWTLESVLEVPGVKEALDATTIVHADALMHDGLAAILVLRDNAYPGDKDDYAEVQGVKAHLRSILDPMGVQVR